MQAAFQVETRLYGNGHGSCRCVRPLSGVELAEQDKNSESEWPSLGWETAPGQRAKGRAQPVAGGVWNRRGLKGGQGSRHRRARGMREEVCSHVSDVTR